MDPGKVNGPLHRFITFIQTDQPVNLRVLGFIPSGNCSAFISPSLSGWHFSRIQPWTPENLHIIGSGLSPELVSDIWRTQQEILQWDALTTTQTSLECIRRGVAQHARHNILNPLCRSCVFVYSPLLLTSALILKSSRISSHFQVDILTAGDTLEDFHRPLWMISGEYLEFSACTESTICQSQDIYRADETYSPSLIVTIAVLKPNLNMWMRCVSTVGEQGRKIPPKRTVKLIWHPVKGVWGDHWLKETSHPSSWPMSTSGLRTNSHHCHFPNKEWLCPLFFSHLWVNLNNKLNFVHNSEEHLPWLWFSGCGRPNRSRVQHYRPAGLMEAMNY